MHDFKQKIRTTNQAVTKNKTAACCPKKAKTENPNQNQATAKNKTAACCPKKAKTENPYCKLIISGCNRVDCFTKFISVKK